MVEPFHGVLRFPHGFSGTNDVKRRMMREKDDERRAMREDQLDQLARNAPTLVLDTY